MIYKNIKINLVNFDLNKIKSSTKLLLNFNTKALYKISHLPLSY